MLIDRLSQHAYNFDLKVKRYRLFAERNFTSSLLSGVFYKHRSCSQMLRKLLFNGTNGV